MTSTGPPLPLHALAAVGQPDAAAAADWLAASPAALAQVSASGHLAWANAAAAALLGAPGPAAAGQALAALLQLDDADAALLQAALLQGGGASVQRRAGGKAVAALAIAVQPLPDGRRLLSLTAGPAAPPPGHGTPALSYGEMQSQLALAVDLAGIAVWRHDFAADLLHLNAQACAVLGLPPQPQGVAPDALRALIHPDDLDEAKAAFEAALASGRPVDNEMRYRRSDGSWRTMMTRRVVQAGSQGRPQAMVGVALDITERLGESRRAAELGRRFELATRAAGIGYWSQDSHDERPRWSDQLRAIHGLAADATVPTLQEWLQGHVHADDRADAQRRFDDWLKSGRRNLRSDMRIVRSDGAVRYLITHSRVEGGSNGHLLFGLVIDATERRAVEQALRQASERASLAARGVGLGTWEVDLQADTAYWDAQMWTLRGLAPRAEAPTADERLAMVHADDRQALLRSMDAVLHGDAPTNYEFRVVLPDGRLRWLASRSTAVHDAEGRMVRRIGVNWDVTDSRTTDAVRQEREIALRESEAKSKFLARMSHELRTPLNAVLGFAQLLQAEEAGDDAAAALRRQRVQHISAAGQHLLQLINDVLDLSSLEGGEMRIALQPVALAPLVAETLPLLEPLLRGSRVELVTGTLEAVALADATRLRQVLLNLLTNAIKYNRAGGRVTLEATQRGTGGVVVRVSDTGRGMTDLQLRHLFEPFNRLGIEQDAIEGTGIGLAIVKALVERMGGSVHVDSTLGGGSVFELRLADGSAQPEMPPPAPPAPAEFAPGAAIHVRPAPSAAAAAWPRGRLLYVEDNPVNALIVSELIARRADLHLDIAVDGLSGLRMAGELRPDLVLLDMQLPDIDGHEVLRRLRAEPGTSAIPVIALSANAMPDDIARALRAGMSGYWTKPLDLRTFMDAMDALFGPGPAG